MKVIAVSDTHLVDHMSYILKDVKSADLLIHAGDALDSGSKNDWYCFLKEMEEVKSKFRTWIYVPGNHDRYVEKNLNLCKEEVKSLGGHLLAHEKIVIDGIKFFGSPYVPQINYVKVWAFEEQRGDDIDRRWKSIPESIDVLITHGPPSKILDYAPQCGNVGCYDLRRHVRRVKPQVHIFGHVHHSNGSLGSQQEYLNTGNDYFKNLKTHFYNVAYCDESYWGANKYTEIEI